MVLEWIKKTKIKEYNFFKENSPSISVHSSCTSIIFLIPTTPFWVCWRVWCLFFIFKWWWLLASGGRWWMLVVEVSFVVFFLLMTVFSFAYFFHFFGRHKTQKKNQQSAKIKYKTKLNYLRIGKHRIQQIFLLTLSHTL